MSLSYPISHTQPQWFISYHYETKTKVLSAGLPYCYYWRGMGFEWPSYIPTNLY